MYKLVLSKRTRAFLEKLSPKPFRQVVRKIFALCEDPKPQDSRLLKGYHYHRVDVGKYRFTMRQKRS